MLNAAKMWTCLPMLVAILLPVVEAKYFLGDAGAERDWLVDPYGAVWFTSQPCTQGTWVFSKRC